MRPGRARLPVVRRVPRPAASRVAATQAFEACDAAVRRLLGADPVGWAGTLEVYCCGKAGEVVFLTGTLPGIRRRLPAARIVLRTMEHYRPAAEHAASRFDDLSALPAVAPSLVDSVTHHYMDRVHDGFLRTPGGLRINAYRTHGWARPIGFPFAFAEAVGIPASEYARPGWDDGSPSSPPIALALATMNQHGGARRRLPFTPAEWHRLALELGGAGMRCVATGHPDDGTPGEMPGWTLTPCGLREAMGMVRTARFLVGGNSGMAFLASAVGQGMVVMIDEAAHGHLPLYDPARLAGSMDLSRLRKIRIRPDGGDDRRAFEETLSAASSSGFAA